MLTKLEWIENVFVKIRQSKISSEFASIVTISFNGERKWFTFNFSLTIRMHYSSTYIVTCTLAVRFGTTLIYLSFLSQYRSFKISLLQYFLLSDVDLIYDSWINFSNFIINYKWFIEWKSTRKKNDCNCWLSSLI